MSRVLQAWGSLRFRDWAGSFLAGLLAGIVQKMGGEMILLWWWPDGILALLLHRGVSGVIFMLVVRALEAQWPKPGNLAYLAACFASAAACAVAFWAWCLLNVAWGFGLRYPAPALWSLVSGFFATLVPGVVLVFVYVHVRRSRDARRRVFEREAGLARGYQREAASGLEEERRRLDPREMAAEMRGIAQAFARESSRADAALDVLIQRLRDVSRSSTGTVPNRGQSPFRASPQSGTVPVRGQSP